MATAGDQAAGGPPGTVDRNPGLPAAIAELARLWGPRAEPLLSWLRPLADADDPRVWSSSRLAPGGFPVEVSFCSATPRTARWAADPAPYQVPPTDRLGVALARLDRYGVPAVQDLAAELLGLLAGAQRAADELIWGAWVGARVTADACRWKVYVEVPCSAADAVHTELLDRLNGQRLPIPRSSLRMLALDLAGTSPVVERYYLAGGLSPEDVHAVGASAGCPDAVAGLLALAEQIAGRPLGVGLPGGRHRVSLRQQPSGEAVMSVIAPARHWIGDDPAIRKRLLAIGESAGQDTTWYRRLTAGCSAVDRRAHGLLTLSAGTGRPADWTVGLRPV
jgi:hypothetical protein